MLTTTVYDEVTGEYYTRKATEFDGVGDPGEETHMITRTWKVYGAEGHRQRESFFESYTYDFTNGNDVRIIDVQNSDKTGTNEYTVISITRNTAAECERELSGQISDGIFENSRVGRVEEIV